MLSHLYTSYAESYLLRREGKTTDPMTHFRVFGLNYGDALFQFKQSQAWSNDSTSTDTNAQYSLNLLHKAQLALKRAWIDISLMTEALAAKTLNPLEHTGRFFEELTSIERIIITRERELRRIA